MLHTSLVARYADLPAHLAAANVGAGQSSDGPLSSLSVHWMADGRRRRLPRVATALESAELMRMAAESRLLPPLQAAQAALAPRYARGQSGAGAVRPVARRAGGRETPQELLYHRNLAKQRRSTEELVAHIAQS